MLRQEIADKEELAELSQNEMEIAKQREIEQKDEIQKLRSQLLKARLDQDEIDELRTKGTTIYDQKWPTGVDHHFFRNFVEVFNSNLFSADQLVRAQQESTRLRERLSDFDFFKARVEELQKENSNLYDARAALETEIAANRIRLAGMNDQVSHQN